MESKWSILLFVWYQSVGLGQRRRFLQVSLTSRTFFEWFCYILKSRYFLSYSSMIFLPVHRVVTWPPLTTSQSKYSWPVKRRRPHIRVMTSTFTSVSRRTSTSQGPWALTGRRANLSLLLLGVLVNLVRLFGQLFIRNVFHLVRFSHFIF